METIHPLSISDDDVAKEKGRLMAAQAMAQNPEQRKLVEDVYGLEYCRKRYPEVYAKPSAFGRLLDKIKFRQW